MYYNRINHVLEQYPFVVSNSHKGRGVLICATDMGMKSVKEYKGSQARADFLYHVLNFVKEGGHPLVDCIALTKEGSTLARDGEHMAVLARDWHEGRECDAKNKEDILRGMRELASLHNRLNSFAGEIPDFLKAKPDTLLLEYKKHSREMKKVKHYVSTKKKKNDFELEYMKHFDSFLKQAEQVTKLQEQEPEQEGMYGICHGDYNQHNVLFSKDGIAILNFERSFYGLQVQDVSNFMRKILEKHNWSYGLGMDMLDVYQSVRMLKDEEIYQLNIRLTYPEKFWKISNYYYNSNKAWACGRNLEKLVKLIEQNEYRQGFLDKLSHKISNK